MPTGTRYLLARLTRSARGWDRALLGSFMRYVSQRPRAGVLSDKTASPYWLVIPDFLAGAGTKGGGAEFLRDVLYGQVCVFLAVKIHDDVFDGHTDDRSLIFAADHLLMDAREAFTRHFPHRSPFWKFFGSAVRETLNAIAATDGHQRVKFGSAASVRLLARKGYAVCNLATYAACLKTGRGPLFRRIRRCTDELAYVGQLLDDMEDMQADLMRGRRNYAVQYLAGGAARGEKWFAMLRTTLDRARGAARLTRVEPLVAQVSQYDAAVDAAEESFNRALLGLIFGSI